MATNNSANIPTSASGTVLQGQGAGAELAFSTATYPATTTINQVLYSSAANTVGGLATANQAVLTTGATGVPVLTALATNGQLIIGSTAGAPAAGNITGDSSISVTNNSNAIALAVKGGGITWNNVSGTSQTVFSSSGYIANNAGLVTFTMNTVNIGDYFRIVGHGAGGWTLLPHAASSQLFYFGNSISTVTTGSLSSTLVGDCIEMVALSTTVIIVISSIGDITVV